MEGRQQGHYSLHACFGCMAFISFSHTLSKPQSTFPFPFPRINQVQGKVRANTDLHLDTTGGETLRVIRFLRASAKTLTTHFRLYTYIDYPDPFAPLHPHLPTVTSPIHPFTPTMPPPCSFTASFPTRSAILLFSFPSVPHSSPPLHVCTATHQ